MIKVTKTREWGNPNDSLKLNFDIYTYGEISHYIHSNIQLFQKWQNTVSLRNPCRFISWNTNFMIFYDVIMDIYWYRDFKIGQYLVLFLTDNESDIDWILNIKQAIIINKTILAMPLHLRLLKDYWKNFVLLDK